MINNNDTVYIVGVDDPQVGVGYVDKRVYAGNFTITKDILFAREFPSREEAERYAALLNNLASFEENLTGVYVVLEYTKTVRPVPLNLGGDA